MAFEKVVYLAHPVSGDIERNLENFKKWYRWALIDMGVIPVCPWFSCCHALDDNNVAERELGIMMDHAFLTECSSVISELWLCGPKISAGMQGEKELAVRLGIPVKHYVGML